MSDLEIRRGDSYDWGFVFKTKGVPLDIRGKKLTFTLKSELADADENALVQITTTFPNTTDCQNGIGSMFIPISATESLPAGTVAHYDFQLSFLDSSSRVQSKTLASGTVPILFDVTQTVPEFP